jgi:hypothetical protein
MMSIVLLVSICENYLFLHVVQRIWTVDSEAYNCPMRVGIRERAQPIVIFLSCHIPHSQFDMFPINFDIGHITVPRSGGLRNQRCSSINVQTHPESQPFAMHEPTVGCISDIVSTHDKNTHYIMYVFPEQPSPTTTILRLISAPPPLWAFDLSLTSASLPPGNLLDTSQTELTGAVVVDELTDREESSVRHRVKIDASVRTRRAV